MTDIEGSVSRPWRGLSEPNTGYVLAVDCGSTNLKAALFDQRLGRAADGSEPVAYAVRNAERVDFEAEGMWQAAAELIRQTCRRAGVAPRQVYRIALTSQAQTFALVDKRGTALTPFISWLDARATEQAVYLEERFGREYHVHCSFAPPMAILQVAKVLWLKQNAPEILRRTACVAPLPTWLAMKLGGVNAVDHNLAAMSGLYSLRSGGWWPEALSLCGLGEGQLPPLIEMGVPLRAQRPCQELCLAGSLQIVFAGNDQTCGAFANGCRPGEVVATLGTALVAYRCAGDRPGPYAESGCWGPYPGGDYYELVVLGQGCAALDWAREQLLPEADVEAFVDCARSARCAVAHTDPVCDQVYFYPERMGTPLAWRGPHDRARRALAVLEGIGYALRQMIYDELRCSAGLGSVTVVGGGSRSDFWLQLLADILDCPVQRGYGDALLGAAMMAVPGAAPPLPAPDVFVPERPNARAYRAHYRLWATGPTGETA